MPNIKSAIKRVSLTARYNVQNKAVRTGMKTIIKKFDAAVEGKSANTLELFKAATKAIDKAAAKKTIHKNAANRKKAQLARKLQVNS